MAPLPINEAMGFIAFGLGVVLILLGIMIIVIQALLKSFLRRLQEKIRAKIDVKEVGPWDFMLKLLEEIFKDAPRAP